MKICLTELKKIIKEKNYELDRLLSIDRNNCSTRVDSANKEEQIKDIEYDYAKQTKEIELLCAELIDCTAKLNVVTATTVINDGAFEVTLSCALAKLKYLNKQKDRLSNMIVIDKTKSLTYDKRLIETVYFYDEKEVREQYDKITGDITQLQMLIDRTNLSTMIEI